MLYAQKSERGPRGPSSNGEKVTLLGSGGGRKEPTMTDRGRFKELALVVSVEHVLVTWEEERSVAYLLMLCRLEEKITEAVLESARAPAATQDHTFQSQLEY
jgi:hypothetical protein